MAYPWEQKKYENRWLHSKKKTFFRSTILVNRCSNFDVCVQNVSFSLKTWLIINHMSSSIYHIMKKKELSRYTTIRYLINLLFQTIFVHCTLITIKAIHENYSDGYSCPINLVPPHSIHWYFCGNFPKGLFDHATAYAQCISSAYSI